jgi:hypothetical protein
VAPSDPTADVDVERMRRENQQLRRAVAEQAQEIEDLNRQLGLRQWNSATRWNRPPPGPVGRSLASVSASRAVMSALT